MKQMISIVVLTSVLMLASCDKDEINNTDTRVGISDVTVYPTLTLEGERFMAIPVGSTWTDPGVTAMEGPNTISYTTSGNVNTGAVGVYRLVYTAINKDGFAATIMRWVAVYDTDASAAGNDLSGQYRRSFPGNAADGQIATWTKIAPGVYVVDNPGGAVGVNLQVIVFNATGFDIEIPPQTITDGTTFSSSDETYDPGPPASYIWTMVNPGYGTAPRTFFKI